MNIREVQMDLFKVEQGYYLAHCISGDYSLGAGVALKFVDIYNMKDKLFRQHPHDLQENPCSQYVGKALVVDNVFNLVTKPNYYNKPRYGTLRECLEDMKKYAYILDIKKIAMPRIGCGLDGLDWENVRTIIEDVFEDTDVDILICYL